ncbi:unnamed protein product [Trichobilharzia regenti]|nr:unnamed protein product [Trichobilharzia regenti]
MSEKRRLEDKCTCCKCSHAACYGIVPNCTTYRADYRGRDSERPLPIYPRDNLIVGAPLDCAEKCLCRCSCNEDDRHAQRMKRYVNPNEVKPAPEKPKPYCEGVNI